MINDYSYLSEKIDSLPYTNSLKELILKSGLKVYELAKNSPVSKQELTDFINEKIDEFMDYINLTFDEVISNANQLISDNNSLNELMENVYDNVLFYLQDYEIMLENFDIPLITSYASSKAREELSLSNNHKGLIHYLISPILNYYLSKSADIFELTSKINDEWHNFVLNNYYGDISIEGSLENTIINELITNNVSWRETLIAKITESESDNILFNKFLDWFITNYNNLLDNFYKWSFEKYPSGIMINSFITGALLNDLTTNDEGTITISEFIDVSKKIISLFTNDNIKSIFSKNNSFNDYYQSLIKEVNNYLNYGSNGISHKLINDFAGTVTKLFINNSQLYLTHLIRGVDDLNERIKMKHAQCIIVASKNIDSLMMSKQGVNDDFFSSITGDELNSVFEVNDSLPKIPELLNIKGAYGRLRSRVSEVIRRHLKLSDLNDFVSTENININSDNAVNLLTDRLLSEKILSMRCSILND